MAFLGAGSTLLAYDSGGSAATAQTKVYAVSCTSNAPDTVDWQIVAQLTQSGGATSPVAALAVDVSADGTNWVTALGLNTTGSTLTAQSIATPGVPKWVRVKMTPGGGTNPAVVAGVQLFASAGFTATLQA